jgi:hypothetical protein
MEEFVLIPLSLWKSWQNSDQIQSVAPKSVDSKISSNENIKNDSIQKIGNDTEDINHEERLLGQLNNFHLNAKTYLIRSIFKNTRTEVSLNDTIVLDGTDTNVKIIAFVDLLTNGRTKNHVPDIILSILSILNVPSHIVSNKHAVETNIGDWIPAFKN